MLLSTVIIVCNLVDSAVVVVTLIALAFFGKGIGSLGWAVMSDTSPRQAPGLNAGLFNTFGNVAGITTPIAIGYIVKASSGSFAGRPGVRGPERVARARLLSFHRWSNRARGTRGPSISIGLLAKSRS